MFTYIQIYVKDLCLASQSVLSYWLKDNVLKKDTTGTLKIKQKQSGEFQVVLLLSSGFRLDGARRCELFHVKVNESEKRHVTGTVVCIRLRFIYYQYHYCCITYIVYVKYNLKAIQCFVMMCKLNVTSPVCSVTCGRGLHCSMCCSCLRCQLHVSHLRMRGCHVIILKRTSVLNSAVLYV